MEQKPISPRQELEKISRALTQNSLAVIRLRNASEVAISRLNKLAYDLNNLGLQIDKLLEEEYREND